MIATASTTEQTTPENLTPEQIEAYRRDGFVRVSGILSPEEIARFRAAASEYSQGGNTLSDRPVFQQMVNVWAQDETLRALTMHPNVAQIAEKLAGVPLRLWHDQILIKKPHNNAATEFHQDQPYWPHANSQHPITCWIALVDVPVERGCMTFIPGSKNRTDLRAQNLQDANSLFSICPEMAWEERVTVPLRAGDCTFHHGRCAHMAMPNSTDEARLAHAIIFIDAETTFTGEPHVVTQKLGLVEGEMLEHEMFPLAADFN